MREGDKIEDMSTLNTKTMSTTFTIPYYTPANDVILDKNWNASDDQDRDLNLTEWVDLVADRLIRIENVLKIVPRNHFLEMKYPKLKKAGDHYDTNPALFADQYKAKVREYAVLEKLKQK